MNRPSEKLYKRGGARLQTCRVAIPGDMSWRGRKSALRGAVGPVDGHALQAGQKCSVLKELKGSEFVRKIKRLGTRQGVSVRLASKRGKGSHLTLHYGAARTVIQDLKRENCPPEPFMRCSRNWAFRQPI